MYLMAIPVTEEGQGEAADPKELESPPRKVLVRNDVPHEVKGDTW